MLCYYPQPNKHRHMGWGGGMAAVPPKFEQLRLFGQQEKFGQSQFLKKFAFFQERYFLF